MAPIPIVSYTVQKLALPIHVPFAIAKQTLHVAQLCIVTLTDANGNVGLGEGSPFPSLTGDTIETVVPATKQLAEAVVNLDPEAALSRLLASKDEVFSQTPCAFVAVEMALWDLIARQMNCGLSALWGRAPSRQCLTDITLPIMPASTVAQFWQQFGAYGFATIKVKVSGILSDDVARLQAVVEAAPRVAITLDGNQGYRQAGALRLLQELEALNIKPLFFEQPLPEDDWTGLEQLSRQSAVPICLDESVKTTQDVHKMIHNRTAVMLNLKIMKSGVAETRKMIEACNAAGIRMMIGGMLESEIAMGASLHLFCGTGAIEFADLDTPFFLREHPTLSSPWHGQHAYLALPPGRGLGLTLDNNKT